MLQKVAASLNWLTRVSLSVAFIINLLILLLYERNREENKTEVRNDSSSKAILAFGVIQAILSICILATYSLKHYPVVIHDVTSAVYIVLL